MHEVFVAVPGAIIRAFRQAVRLLPYLHLPDDEALVEVAVLAANPISLRQQESRLGRDAKPLRFAASNPRVAKVDEDGTARLQNSEHLVSGCPKVTEVL